jgi:hypothetical protein
VTRRDDETLDLDRLWRLHPDVVFRRMPDGGLLVHLGTNQIYELNDTGSRVLEALQAGHDLRTAVLTIAREYGRPPESLQDEVTSLIETLVSNGLAVAD